ncbi:MAG: DUF2254 domain-containing protein [Candidatus Eisenbacteria bacterium]|nr:DUF2254 domain-containing protein [Candidatus Eisenbacteria bacterium]
MRTWLENRLEILSTNFWTLPAAMAVAALALSLSLVSIDMRVTIDFGGPVGWLNIGSIEGVRTLLATLVGSLVTVLALVFSITIVALTLAASQLGPRLLRNFMRDRSNQGVIGVFTATFLYTLVALLSVGRLEARGVVPHITVFGAFVLTTWSVAVLVYFIHHVSESIQAPNVVLAVSRELEGVITRLFPPNDPEAAPEEPTKPPKDIWSREAGEACSPRSAYVQAINEGKLVSVAKAHDVVLDVELRPGDFVAAGQALASAYGDEPLEEDAREAIADAFFLGERRTATQDVEYVLMQLVEIAVRALSPGINDPFTAMTCIDRIGSALGLLMSRAERPRRLADDDGALRVVLDRTDFDGIMGTGLRQIRQHGSSQAAVLIRMLEVLARLGGTARTDEQRASIRKHADAVARAGEALSEESDRMDIVGRHRAVLAALGDTSEQGVNDTEEGSGT